MRRAVWLIVLAGCGAGDAPGDDSPINDAGSPGDGPQGCITYLDFEPKMPIAGPTTVVRANAVVLNSPGVVGYHWTVTYQSAPVATNFAQADESAITFGAAVAGVYRVRLTVDSAVPCAEADVPFNVLAEGGNQTQVRLRVNPPASAAVPPHETLELITGGAPYSIGNITLVPGVPISAQVRQGTTPIGAYLRFMPLSAAEAAVEAYSNPITGQFSARVLNQQHNVLVVPMNASVAPQLIAGWLPGSPVVLGGSTAVLGSVRTSVGPLAGAKVQLAVDGVPSTLATTAANGGFSVLAVPKLGATITVDVTPPVGSGLPRLTAASPTLVLSQSFDIVYAPLALRDVGGATIRRAGSPVANARLTLVGTIAAVGTIATSGAPVTASGTVRIVATASAAGVVPATLAPARQLSAVVEASANSYAVSPVDLTGGVPATIDAPAPQPITTQIRKPDLVGISGVFLEVVPIDELAMAGASSLRVVSGTNGAIATSLAAGGHYELRFNDPAFRGAALVVPDVTAPTVAAAYSLRTGLLVSGKLLLPSTLPVGNASVQILCSLCSGLERDRPLAETSSDPGGNFALAIPDPGTM